MNFNLDTDINNINYLRYMESQGQKTAASYGDGTVWKCPDCECMVSALAKHCPACGYTYKKSSEE